MDELANGKQTAVAVDIGAVGDTLTQISSGVKVGDRVVLADLRTPIPTLGSTSDRATLALSGGITRGAFRAVTGGNGGNGAVRPAGSR